MEDNTLILMLFGSLILGGLGVMAFIWGLKTNQFDDEEKFKSGAFFDGEDELRDAIERERKAKESKNI